MSENTEPDVEVTDGEIEWEPGNIVDIDPSELEGFEKNEEIYGDTEDIEEKFVESVREKGVLEPLVVDQDKTIISGHRRWSASLKVGVDEVPVRVSEFESEIEKREALIEFNRQRDKTPAQVVNEFEEQVEIEKEKAKERKGVRTDLDGDTSGESSPEVQRARDEAADKINADVTGETIEKGQKVKEIAEGETDKEEEVVEVAKQKWEELEEGEESFHGAYSSVKEKEREFEEEPVTETPKVPEGDGYKTLVIDPPWPMEKIGRDERPDQGKYLDYPTMDMEDIKSLPVDDLCLDSGSHIYLWTTQKFLPDALECLEEWGARYECMLTWVKPTGVTPFSWQYNTEHVLFARYGDGLKMDDMGQQLSFEAPVKKHSEKPDVFYKRVKNASPRPRLEMFARESEEGFEVWGDEV